MTDLSNTIIVCHQLKPLKDDLLKDFSSKDIKSSLLRDYLNITKDNLITAINHPNLQIEDISDILYRYLFTNKNNQDGIDVFDVYFNVFRKVDIFFKELLIKVMRLIMV